MITKTGRELQNYLKKVDFLIRPTRSWMIAMPTSKLKGTQFDILKCLPRKKGQPLKVSAVKSKSLFKTLKKPYRGWHLPLLRPSKSPEKRFQINSVCFRPASEI